MRRIVALAAVALLSGCVSNYVEPEGKDVAWLTIRNELQDQVWAQGFQNATDCSGKVNFPSGPYVPPRGEVRFRVAPSAPFSFYVGHGMSKIQGSYLETTSCTMPVTFTPKAGASYVVRFWADFAQRRCRLSMTIDDGGAQRAEPSFRLRESQRPFTENGPFCK